MQSRKLAISSLLCNDSTTIPDPVVLAPHLRNPNIRRTAPSPSFFPPPTPLSSSPASSSSTHSPLSSSRSPHQHPFAGLDALVHVASQESKRLSVSASASPIDMNPTISPVTHWQNVPREDKWQTEDLTHRPPPLLLPRRHPIPDDRPSPVTDDPRDRSVFQTSHSHYQQLLPSDRPTRDQPRTPLSDPTKHPHIHYPPHLIIHDRPPPTSPTSAIDSPRRARPYPPQSHHYPHRPDDSRSPVRRTSDISLPSPSLLFHDRAANPQEDYKRGPVGYPPPRSHHQFPEQDRPVLQASPVISYSHHQRVQEMVPPLDRDPVPQQRRRVSSPISTTDDRPAKRRRSSSSANDAVASAKVEEVHFRSRQLFSPKPSPPPNPIHHAHETDSASSRPYTVDAADFKPPIVRKPTGRSKHLISDMLNAEPTQERTRPLPSNADVDADANTKEQISHAAMPNHPEHGGVMTVRDQDKDVRPDVSVNKQESQQQDPHEWLLQHYGHSSPPPKAPATPPILSTPSPTRSLLTVASPVQQKPPEAPTVASFKQEIEQPAEMCQAYTNISGDLDPDVDVVSDFVAETLDGTDSHCIAAMEVDIADELLSLLDPPAASHPLRYQPPAPSPLSQQHHPPPRRSSPSSDKPAESISGRASPSLHLTPVAAVPPSGSPPLATPTLERGSMPPPPSTTVSGTGPPKKGESAGGTKKKKEGASKSAAKLKQPPKQPPKPRTKPAPKAKKTAADGSTNAPTGKGAKGSSFPATAVPSAMRKSLSASRSRSTSLMPRGSIGPEGDTKEGDDMEGDEENAEPGDNGDDKLYCVCKTRYDEDRVMIACDRCDEWYHTLCVDMPDLEIDLVDQFICPPCIEKHPELSLKTTYKLRCLLGLRHADPASPSACHKPARGVFSKYCSDECGVTYMQSRIDAWIQKGGKRTRLWESVKGAEKREGVVVCAEATGEGTKMDVDEKGVVAAAAVRAVNVKVRKGKVERETELLNAQLNRVVRLRERIKKEMEVVVWRRRLLELAGERAESMGQCGWDQRLCFGDEEWTEFGTGVLESYEEIGGDRDAMQVDGAAAEEEGEWWCVGKKMCERHAGWQALRAKDVAHETQMREESLLKLTTQEREIRKRIEDILDQDHDSNDTSKALLATPNAAPSNGRAKANGDQAKKGKKKKTQLQ